MVVAGDWREAEMGSDYPTGTKFQLSQMRRLQRSAVSHGPCSEQCGITHGKIVKRVGHVQNVLPTVK